MLMLYIFWVIC
ncbi:UDP-2,3-diacylglucosamine hydrolase, partial [Yersinia pestis PY-54]